MVVYVPDNSCKVLHSEEVALVMCEKCFTLYEMLHGVDDADTAGALISLCANFNLPSSACEAGAKGMAHPFLEAVTETGNIGTFHRVHGVTYSAGLVRVFNVNIDTEH